MAMPTSLAHAEDVWVKSKQVKLTLRTGAGTQYRIIGGLQTGDSVQILSLTDGWTEVRTPDGKEGFVSAGFLDPEPPPVIALTLLEEETAALRDQVVDFNKQVAGLNDANAKLISEDDGQRSEIERLTRENFELTAGQRWPEWITGGGIVLLGMALGAILSRSSGRRQQKIRL
jgi:SH3 domain protein